MTEPTARASRRAWQDGRISHGAAIVWFGASYGGAILGYLALNAFAARLLGDTFGYFVLVVTVYVLYRVIAV